MQKKRNFEVPQAVDDEVNIHQIPFIQNNSILETIETTNLQISNNNLNKEMVIKIIIIIILKTLPIEFIIITII